MKHSRIKFLLLFAVVFMGEVDAKSFDTIAGQRDSLTVRRYEKRLHRYQVFWNRLIPDHTKIQFAGSIGVAAVGVGWHYGARHDTWETDLLLGFVPKYSSEHNKTTFTIRQTYIPWHLHLVGPLECSPLACGLFFSTITGDDFWSRLPDKYPKKYYGFSTKVRAHVFLEQRLKFNIPQNRRVWHKSVEFYYQLSTCDLYVASYVTNSSLKLKDVLSLAFGLRMEVF